jgi:hypothetical protein
VVGWVLVRATAVGRALQSRGVEPGTDVVGLGVASVVEYHEDLFAGRRLR